MEKYLKLALLGVAAVAASSLSVQYLPPALDFAGVPVRKYGGAAGAAILVHKFVF